MEKDTFIKKHMKFSLLIWIFFIIELVVLFVVFYFILAPKELVQSKKSSDIGLMYFAYIFTIIAIPVSSKIYSVLKNKAKEKKHLKGKLDLYQIAFMLKAGIFQTAAVLLLVTFYFNQIYSPLYLLSVVFIAFFFNKPSVSNFKKDFDIEDDNAIIPMNEDDKITSETKY